jgi:hypothetical protein
MLRVLDLVKACVPVETTPGDVFTVIEQALRSQYAKEIWMEKGPSPTENDRSDTAA